MIVNNNTAKTDFSTKVCKHALHYINAHSIHSRPPPCCFCLTFLHSELRAGTDILCGPKDHNSVYESLTPIPIMSQMNPLHIPTPYLPDIILLLLYLPTNKQALQIVPAWHVSQHLSCIYHVSQRKIPIQHWNQRHSTNFCVCVCVCVCVWGKNVFSWAECSLAILFYSTCVINNAV
jgi:hypothetical protein